MLLITGAHKSPLGPFQRKFSRGNRIKLETPVLGGNHPDGLNAICRLNQRNTGIAERPAIERTHDGAGYSVQRLGRSTLTTGRALCIHGQIQEKQHKRSSANPGLNPPSMLGHSYSFPVISDNWRFSLCPAATLITCALESYRDITSSFANSNSGC